MPLLVFALGFARFELGQKALAGVSMLGEPLGGVSADEAKRRIEARARGLASQKLQLWIGDKHAAVGVEELGFSVSASESAARLLAVGRNAGFLTNAWVYLRSWWASQAVPAQLRIDDARLQARLDELEARLIDDAPYPGGLSVAVNAVTALPPRPGRKIARQASRDLLSEALDSGLAQRPIHLASETVTPQLAPGALERAQAAAQNIVSAPLKLEATERTLALEPVELATLLSAQVEAGELELQLDPVRLEAWLAPQRSTLDRPARDASFQVSAQDRVSVVPAEAGRRVVAEDVALALFGAAKAATRTVALPFRQEPLPALSTVQAEQLGIKGLVGSFTTRHPCCQPRVENIHRIALLLDGLVVQPGQTVSLNEVVGPRTQKKGFVLAPGIEDGEMVDSVGGGVSQFATTFFNALFHAGYDIIERQPHSYWFPRYPMAIEATLGWPKPDIIFKNDSSAGLLVKTSFTKTSITVKLYGDVGGRKVSSSVSERRDIVKPPAELLPNRDVPPDEEKVKDGGMIGWSVIASRTVTFADGSKKEERRKVTYKPKARRVEVHPCRIPDGEPGATGEKCPEPPDAEQPEPDEALEAHAD